ncbi:ABC transporter permease [Microbispora sp. H10836]|uniref:ABC transporter permease n=1 Tax=Microbispora sp. H10836 TaxID=2729106 RepID=UPI001473187E|nr:ABC transporter permease [Microbispora sp. H10836]
MSQAALVTILSTGVLLAVPVLWAALGELIVEKSGTLNLGVEGVMLIGAATAALVVKAGAGFAAAALVSLPVGALCGAVLAYLYVSRRTDQIVTGILFNLVALGLTTTLFARYLNGVGEVSTAPRYAVPLLSRIPVVGPSLFTQTPLFYLSVAAAVLVLLAVHGTWFGLGLLSAGEQPRAAETAGIDVIRVRWKALLAGNALAGLGGACIVLTQSGAFLPNITNGQGYIALAVVVLGRFKPAYIVLGAVFFGIANAFQFQLQSLPFAQGYPRQLWLALPYIATIVAVTLSRSARYPAAVGRPYVPAARRG